MAFRSGYEVFPGNMNDARTVQKIVTTMEARHGVIGRVWIADRGMSSAAQPRMAARDGATLHHRRAEVGAEEARRALAEYDAAGVALREGVEVKLTRCPETSDTIILCRSAERRDKERAMHEKFSPSHRGGARAPCRAHRALARAA